MKKEILFRPLPKNVVLHMSITQGAGRTYARDKAGNFYMNTIHARSFTFGRSSWGDGELRAIVRLGGMTRKQMAEHKRLIILEDRKDAAAHDKRDFMRTVEKYGLKFNTRELSKIKPPK